MSTRIIPRTCSGIRARVLLARQARWAGNALFLKPVHIPSTWFTTSSKHSEHTHQSPTSTETFKVETQPHKDKSFDALGIAPTLCQKLAATGISIPTEVQRKAITPILQRTNTIVTAETGSGKTLAYLAPLITRLTEYTGLLRPPSNKGCASWSPRVLILVPTRDLCIQILRTLRDVARGLKLKAVVLPPPPSVPASQINYPDIAVATPKGIADLFSSPRRTKEFLYRTDALVVDEADWVIGDPIGWKFVQQAASISKHRNDIPDSNLTGSKPMQFIFVAATLPPVKTTKSKTPRALLERTIPDLKTVGTRDLHSPPPGVRERFIRLVPQHREEEIKDEEETDLKCKALISLLLDNVKSMSASTQPVHSKWLVFCNSTKRAHQAFAAVTAAKDLIMSEGQKEKDVDRTPVVLKCSLVHSGMQREERAEMVLDFVTADVQRDNPSPATFRVLICTDVVARGLDFVDVSTVVQLDFARDAAMYLHRVGRTARIGKQGEAIGFISPSDYRLADIIERASMGVKDPKLENHSMFIETMTGEGSVAACEQEPSSTNGKLPLTGLLSRNRGFSSQIKKRQREKDRNGGVHDEEANQKVDSGSSEVLT